MVPVCVTGKAWFLGASLAYRGMRGDCGVATVHGYCAWLLWVLWIQWPVYGSCRGSSLAYLVPPRQHTLRGESVLVNPFMEAISRCFVLRRTIVPCGKAPVRSADPQARLLRPALAPQAIYITYPVNRQLVPPNLPLASHRPFPPPVARHPPGTFHDPFYVPQVYDQPLFSASEPLFSAFPRVHERASRTTLLPSRHRSVDLPYQLESAPLYLLFPSNINHNALHDRCFRPRGLHLVCPRPRRND